MADLSDEAGRCVCVSKNYFCIIAQVPMANSNRIRSCHKSLLLNNSKPIIAFEKSFVEVQPPANLSHRHPDSLELYRVHSKAVSHSRLLVVVYCSNTISLRKTLYCTRSCIELLQSRSLPL